MENTLYNTLLERLFFINKNGGMKLGLENTKLLSRALFDPHQNFRSIHIAGSNGKGSVSTKMAAALQIAGFRTGLYTSPHISSFRERIRISGLLISESDIVRWLTKIFALIDELEIIPTFFEITTLLAFAYFAEQNIDFAVIETGIGGRLDATNIILPELSVITSISLEHTDILGKTLELITQEKAGIIKPKVPLVIGPKVNEDIIMPIAKAKNSPYITVKGNFDDYHAENNAIAKTALQTLGIHEDCINKGLKAVPECRTELIEKINSNGVKKKFILDVAHNPDGFQCLAKFLNQHFPNSSFTFVIGMSSNKDIKLSLRVIKPIAKRFFLVETNGDRAAPKELLMQYLIDCGVLEDQIRMKPSINQTISSIVDQDDEEIIVVAGTFFIMNDVKKALSINNLEDPLNLNESSISNQNSK